MIFNIDKIFKLIDVLLHYCRLRSLNETLNNKQVVDFTKKLENLKQRSDFHTECCSQLQNTNYFEARQNRNNYGVLLYHMNG